MSISCPLFLRRLILLLVISVFTGSVCYGFDIKKLLFDYLVKPNAPIIEVSWRDLVQYDYHRKIIPPRLQSIEGKFLEEAVPSTFRDPAGNWFGLTIRARLIYASKERVQENDITYEELTSSKWNRRICSRSGKNDYNIDLIASMVAHHGLEETKLWLKGVKENLARRPQGNDRAQVKAIYVGQCDISLGNSYYFGKMLADKEQQEWARSVKLLFPNQENRGTHVNISGMALTKYAPNREDAIKLMRFLVSEEAQKIYAEVNYEFPVRQGVALSPLLKPYEGFISDKIPLIDFIQYRRDASILVDQVGFDE